MTPTPGYVRLQAVVFLGLLFGGTAAAASGYGLTGAVLTALVIGFMCGLAMIAKLALEAADRRASEPVVREPRSHVSRINDISRPGR